MVATDFTPDANNGPKGTEAACHPAWLEREHGTQGGGRSPSTQFCGNVEYGLYTACLLWKDSGIGLYRKHGVTSHL